MDKSDSDFLCLQELHQRIKGDPANAGWYMHRAYHLGAGSTVDEALELAPSRDKQKLTVVRPTESGASE